MISFQEALKQIDPEKIALIRKNLPSSNRYDSEQMTSEELRKYIVDEKYIEKDINSINGVFVKIKRSSNGHFLGRHIVPVKHVKVSAK